MQVDNRATASPEATMEIGRRLGRSLQPGDVVLLSGTLGAGKTVLARGIAEGLGTASWHGSPTFTLVNEYRGRINMAHVDLYRLSPGESGDLGLEDYMDSDWVLVLEWPERDPDLVEHLTAGRVVSVTIEYASPSEREIRLQDHAE